MRIDPSSINQVHSHLAPRGARNKGEASTSATSSDSSVRSGELRQLVERAASNEEIRPEVVKAVRANIEAGVYSTQEAATQTAEALIEAST